MQVAVPAPVPCTVVHLVLPFTRGDETLSTHLHLIFFEPLAPP